MTGRRVAGRWAIISGIFGIAAFACLIAFLVMRPSENHGQTARWLLRGHDAGIIFQSLCLIPLALTVESVARQPLHRSSRSMSAAGVTSLALIVILVVLAFLEVTADVLYMIPQGALGGWLIGVSLRKHANSLPTGLRVLGIVAGVGLLLISMFPIGYALSVDPAILHGPISDVDPTPPGTDRANGIVHIVLAIGTVIGCSMYPLWSVLAGRWLTLSGDGRARNG